MGGHCGLLFGDLAPPLCKMKGCTWVLVATLLCQQFCLFRVMAAKRERKVKKEPNQYTEPFNATLSNSEELHGHPKVGVSVLSAPGSTSRWQGGDAGFISPPY